VRNVIHLFSRFSYIYLEYISIFVIFVIFCPHARGVNFRVTFYEFRRLIRKAGSCDVINMSYKYIDNHVGKLSKLR